MNDRELKQAIADAVRSHVPGAQVLLYGSRARGDADADSDWDIIVVTPQKLGHDGEEGLRLAVYKIEWETGHVLSLLIYDKEDWDRPERARSPFNKAIVRDGIAL